MNLATEAEEHNILKAYNVLLYFAGTMIMWDPSIECIHDFWKQGILKKMPVSSHNPMFMKAAAQLSESIDDKESSFERMQIDYHDLFSSGPRSLAPQVESQFRKSNPEIPGNETPPVTEFYKLYGWKSKFKNRFPEDHLGIELLFLTLLTEKYLELNDEVSRKKMKHEIVKFLELYIRSWVPEWCDAVQSNAKTRSYQGIATLILACCEDIYSVIVGKMVSTGSNAVA